MFIIECNTYGKEYDKEYKNTIIDGGQLIYGDVKGSLILIADRIIDIIYVKYLKKKITYEHLIMVETYQYPIEAVRKAIYNALIHSDYSNSNDIQIKISFGFTIIFKANYKYDYDNLDNQGSTTLKTTQIKNEIKIKILDMIKNNKNYKSICFMNIDEIIEHLYNVSNRFVTHFLIDNNPKMDYNTNEKGGWCE